MNTSWLVKCFALGLILLLSSCINATKGLPPKWPLPQLTLPPGSLVVESKHNTGKGTTVLAEAWLVSFVSTSAEWNSLEKIASHVSECISPIGYSEVEMSALLKTAFESQGMKERIFVSSDGLFSVEVMQKVTSEETTYEIEVDRYSRNISNDLTRDLQGLGSSERPAN